ncbi:MAG: DUF3313 family protein [Pseudomonadota bacterium]
MGNYIFSLLSILIISVSACETTPSVDLTDIRTDEGLITVQNAPFDATLINPDIDVRSYGKIVLGEVLMAYSPRENEFEVPRDAQIRIRQIFEESLIEEISETSGLLLVEDRGPGALRLDVAITDIKINLPEDADRSVNRKTFASNSGTLMSAGILTDSSDGSIISRFYDSRYDTSSYLEEVTRSSISSDFRRIIRTWASTISIGLKDLTTQDPLALHAAP